MNNKMMPETGDNTINYEQLSYGKFAYKRLQRLRRKGRRSGIKIPQLDYGLTKPEKPRIAFWIAAVYFYRFVRDAFYMAKCSKEEFAKGSIISSRILGLVAVIIVATVIFIILLSYISASSAKLYIGLIFS